MLKHKFTRRSAIKLGAAAALPLAAVRSATAKSTAKKKSGLTIGIATLGFGNLTNAQLAEELVEQRIHTVQLFLNQTDSKYWKYNGRSDMSDLTAKRCEKIANDYRSAGIKIHSTGVYTNLIHPDKSERKANLAYFEAMMKAGRDMGVKMFVTEAGHINPEQNPTPRIEYHFQEKVWYQMVDTAKELADICERLDTTVIVEPFYRHFFATAKRTRVFLEAVGSPRFRALLDPANLLEANDTDEMFKQLTPWIDCLHAKDRKLHVDRGVPAGQGDLDYKEFVTLAAKHTPNVPLIMEYVGPKTYKPALTHLRNVMRQVGVAEQ